jgi:hypothetical protein
MVDQQGNRLIGIGGIEDDETGVLERGNNPNPDQGFIFDDENLEIDVCQKRPTFSSVKSSDGIGANWKDYRCRVTLERIEVMHNAGFRGSIRAEAGIADFDNQAGEATGSAEAVRMIVTRSPSELLTVFIWLSSCRTRAWTIAVPSPPFLPLGWLVPVPTPLSATPSIQPAPCVW